MSRFFSMEGGRQVLDAALERHFLLDSDRLDSYARAPRMQALRIGACAQEQIRSGAFDFGLINFANADMVGHTGDLQAAIRGVEAVDSALGGIVEAITACGGLLLITADHGNAEEMRSIDPHSGREEPNTRHSRNAVPLILYDPLVSGSYRLRPLGRSGGWGRVSLGRAGLGRTTCRW